MLSLRKPSGDRRLVGQKRREDNLFGDVIQLIIVLEKKTPEKFLGFTHQICKEEAFFANEFAPANLKDLNKTALFRHGEPKDIPVNRVGRDNRLPLGNLLEAVTYHGTPPLPHILAEKQPPPSLASV